MTELEDLVNIGGALAVRLRDVGISDGEALSELGAFEATRRLEAAGAQDCTHTYLALEGAVRGVRWMSLPEETRRELSATWRLRGAESSP